MEFEFDAPCYLDLSKEISNNNDLLTNTNSNTNTIDESIDKLNDLNKINNWFYIFHSNHELDNWKPIPLSPNNINNGRIKALNRYSNNSTTEDEILNNIVNNKIENTSQSITSTIITTSAKSEAYIPKTNLIKRKSDTNDNVIINKPKMSKPQRVILSSIKPDIIESPEKEPVVESVISKSEELPLTSIENKLDNLDLLHTKRVKATFTFEAKPIIKPSSIVPKRGLENNSAIINQAIKKVKPNLLKVEPSNFLKKNNNTKNELKSLVVEDDDLMQKLKAHNKKVFKDTAYVPQKFSSKDWEAKTGKNWYHLKPDERDQANSEISLMLKTII